MTIVGFSPEFTDKVIHKIGFIDRIVDDWLDIERQSFVMFLKSVYTAEFVYEYGLVYMSKVFEKTLIDEGEKDSKLAAITVYLLQGINVNPIHIMYYNTITGETIELTDISILKHAQFSPEFYNRIENILQTHFLN
jgi:hypothetical protein